MRRLVRGLALASAALFAVGACQGSPTPQGAESPAAKAIPAAPTITPTIATSPPSLAIETPRCDPINQMFAGMFIGLSEAALSNAGIQPSEFFAALATDRVTLKKYLKALGIQADDAQIDVALGANLGQMFLGPSPDAGQSASATGNVVTCK
jgi:hypothetical protein